MVGAVIGIFTGSCRGSGGVAVAEKFGAIWLGLYDLVSLGGDWLGAVAVYGKCYPRRKHVQGAERNLGDDRLA